MGLTVKQLIVELGGIPDGADPQRESAVALFEDSDGVLHSIDGLEYYGLGLPDSESDMPILVLGDDGVVELE